MTFSATTYMVTAKPDKTCPHIKTFFIKKPALLLAGPGWLLFDLRVAIDVRSAEQLIIGIITS